MLYDVGLRITYQYDQPAIAGRHMLRLLPADLPGEQRLVVGYLDVQPRVEERFNRTDFFGNDAVEIAFRSAHAEIEFRIQCRVERQAREFGLDLSPPLDRLAAEIADVRSLGPDAPHHYLGTSPRVRPNALMTEYALDAISAETSVRAAVVAIGEALNRDMKFDSKATTVDTSPEEAFDRQRGVCQDFTHIMIACLRGVGIPAGYVSGYLRTNPPPGKPRLEGADAMHAWVRAWCGADMGWIEYDPTNATPAAGDHIVVARGRDYSDVAPVKGVLRLAGSQKTEQAVDVVPVG
jgi:transglutaminase-like putative cysteine protease